MVTRINIKLFEETKIPNSKYTIIEKISEGAFGTVFKA